MNKRQQKKKLSKTKQLRKATIELNNMLSVALEQNCDIIKENSILEAMYKQALDSNMRLKAELGNYKRNQKVSYFTKEIVIPKMPLMFNGDAKLEARKVMVDAIAQNEEIFELKETDTALIYKLTCIKRLQ